MGLEAMYSAISGLQGDSTWLDVIGNNISNVNTTAYKASRLEFSNQISNNLGSGTGDNPAEGLGGTNPEQVGLGVKVASIDTLFTQGQLQQTGITTDIAITGTGFLDAKVGSSTYLTRAGNLNFDSNGNLVDQNGGLIQGYTASIQYSQTTVDQANGLVVTSANLVLQNNNPGNIGNIQIKQDMVVPPKATTVMNIAGNLDSFQQADQTGGILNVVDAANNGVIPATDGGHVYRGLNLFATGNGQAFQQTDNLALNGAVAPPATIGNSTIQSSTLTLANARANGNYVWNQQPPVSPATETVTTVYDSLGNPHEITTLYYQVNDLGAAGVNTPTAAGQSQAVYAWYAFDTTGGVAPFTGGNPATSANGQDSNLLGGSGIQEMYDRGTTGTIFTDDFLVFNTDGSLASMGAVNQATDTEVQAAIYLPPADPNVPAVSPLPTQGANIAQIFMNFGTAGVLGTGKRDGLISDAEGSFQIVNGVNTYVPSDTATVKSQDGYADGSLQSLYFDKTGTIQGVFSNGKTFALGQVVMTSVANQEGLMSVGNGYYQQTASSGPSFTGLAGTSNLGTVTGSSLEGSNVDLTVELSNMIIAQRGYESNARVISVVNSTLQTLTQL
ncbi:MAG TPA: flagellar hook-basal body complex protein, partial [bacterium]|nr:flagellar hook-basal body complex protein [bacterium]